MIHKDLKIGLVLGLIIVAGIIIKLAIDPRLSTQARLMNINNSVNNLNSLDFNDISQDNILSEVSLGSNSDIQYEHTDPLQFDEPSQEVAKQNDDRVIEGTVFQYRPEQTPEPIHIPAEPAVTSNENNNDRVTGEPQRFHVIEQGQNLSKISSIYYGSPNHWQKIVDANPDVIKNPNKIKPGMRIRIP